MTRLNMIVMLVLSSSFLMFVGCSSGNQTSSGVDCEIHLTYDSCRVTSGCVWSSLDHTPTKCELDIALPDCSSSRYGYNCLRKGCASNGAVDGSDCILPKCVIDVAGNCVAQLPPGSTFMSNYFTDMLCTKDYFRCKKT